MRSTPKLDKGNPHFVWRHSPPDVIGRQVIHRNPSGDSGSATNTALQERPDERLYKSSSYLQTSSPSRTTYSRRATCRVCGIGRRDQCPHCPTSSSDELARGGLCSFSHAHPLCVKLPAPGEQGLSSLPQPGEELPLRRGAPSRRPAGTR